MEHLKDLLESNRRWSERTRETDPEFFTKLARQQSPRLLWIGCSDSRVPASVIVDALPGSIFVHRNIANMVIHSDLNCLSVIQYAVEVLRVRHVVVCGHYGCGGVKAALETAPHGIVDHWLEHIRDVRRLHGESLTGLSPDQECDRLCELNVKEQVKNVCRTTPVQGAWSRGTPLTIHGWIYSLRDGLLHDLGISVDGKATGFSA